MNAIISYQKDVPSVKRFFGYTLAILGFVYNYFQCSGINPFSNRFGFKYS